MVDSSRRWRGWRQTTGVSALSWTRLVGWLGDRKDIQPAKIAVTDPDPKRFSSGNGERNWGELDNPGSLGNRLIKQRWWWRWYQPTNSAENTEDRKDCNDVTTLQSVLSITMVVKASTKLRNVTETRDIYTWHKHNSHTTKRTIFAFSSTMNEHIKNNVHGREYSHLHSRDRSEVIAIAVAMGLSS